VRFAWIGSVSAWLALGCGHHASPVNEPPRYAYAIAPPASGSWTLEVEATFERSPTARLVAPAAEMAVRDVTLVTTGSSTPLARDQDGWLAPPCRSRCKIRYAVDLDALASSCRGFDCTRRVGDAVVGPTATWLLRPESAGDAGVSLQLQAGDPSRFATGLRRSGTGSYVFRAEELGESSYSAFGSLRKTRVQVGGAALDVALLGAPLAMGDRATVGWVTESAGCIARFFGRFPVEATIFVLPVGAADRVLFGRVMSLTGASVALLFGRETPASGVHEDWVVVHELFHLGTPSFVGEGHWLEEGLATYYEPILRERAGWMSEADLWRHFMKQMPRGLRRPGQPASLEERDDIDSTYWGGALFALLCDIRIRQSTGGVRSLDDALRAVLDRQGDATHTARVADFLRVGDEATGGRVLTDTYARYALGGEGVDLDRLWRSLGVDPQEPGTDRAPRLRDDAPLSAVRRALAAGEPH
jgi:predicted metalloprotease with PDZ domain